MKKRFRKICCLFVVVTVTILSVLSVGAAPNSRSWNMYYTNNTSGNHTYESNTIADSLKYTCSISSLSGVNGGKKMTVVVLNAMPGFDRAVFTSVSGSQTIRSTYMNTDRTVTFTLAYTTSGGTCASTGTISK